MTKDKPSNVAASVRQRLLNIIRDDDELNRVREYIANNPAQWETDRENPCFPHEGGSRTAPTPAMTEWAEPPISAAVTGKIDVRGN